MRETGLRLMFNDFYFIQCHWTHVTAKAYKMNELNILHKIHGQVHNYSLYDISLVKIVIWSNKFGHSAEMCRADHEINVLKE